MLSTIEINSRFQPTLAMRQGFKPLPDCEFDCQSRSTLPHRYKSTLICVHPSGNKGDRLLKKV
ncbi:MAG: hypothetical protein HC941_31750 [Microcoleus sp. SU_5_3]|nr:hypothetical protein [Microcoleus sp. SU_5_3]